MPLQITNQYWIVGDTNPTTQVWSGPTGAFLANTNATFKAWLNANDGRADIVPGAKVLGTANNGAGLIRVQVESSAALQTNQVVNFVGNNSSAAGAAAVTVIDATHFDIQGSTFTVADTSGTIWSATMIDTAANLVTVLDTYNRSLFVGGNNFGATSYSSAVDLQLTNPLSQITRITMTAAGKKVILPQMNLPGSIAAGITLRVVNIGANDFDLYLFGGASKVITVAYSSGGLGGVVDFVQVPGGTLTVQSGNIAVLDLYPEMQTTGTSHQVQLKAGGTQADLNATGGAHKFLRQNAVGAAVDVVQPASTDLSDLPIPVSSGGTAYAGGAWTLYTATLAPNSGTFTQGSNQSAYLQIGKIVLFMINETLTITSGAPTSILITLPVAVKRATRIVGAETATVGDVIQFGLAAGQTQGLIRKYDNTVWAPTSGDQYTFIGSYEAA